MPILVPEVNTGSSSSWQVNGAACSLTSTGATFTQNGVSQGGAVVTTGAYERPSVEFSVYMNVSTASNADGVSLGVLDADIEDSTPTIHTGGDIVFGSSTYGLAGTAAQLSSYSDYVRIASRATNGGAWVQHAYAGDGSVNIAPATYQLKYTPTGDPALYDVTLYRGVTQLITAANVPVPANMRFYMGASIGGLGDIWAAGAGSYVEATELNITASLPVTASPWGTYYKTGEITTLQVNRVAEVNQAVEISATKSSLQAAWVPADLASPYSSPRDGFLWYDVDGVFVQEAQWEGWGLHLV
jgi:hypothetical protein